MRPIDTQSPQVNADQLANPLTVKEQLILHKSHLNKKWTHAISTGNIKDAHHLALAHISLHHHEASKSDKLTSRVYEDEHTTSINENQNIHKNKKLLICGIATTAFYAAAGLAGISNVLPRGLIALSGQTAAKLVAMSQPITAFAEASKITDSVIKQGKDASLELNHDVTKLADMKSEQLRAAHQKNQELAKTVADQTKRADEAEHEARVNTLR